jgi:hypothetical protein
MPVRALRIVALVMGVMIVVAVTAIVATIAHRMSRSGPGLGEPLPFAAAPIDLPAGAHIDAISTGGDRLVLALSLPEGTRELMIIDLATGRRLGTIPLRAAP